MRWIKLACSCCAATVHTCTLLTWTTIYQNTCYVADKFGRQLSCSCHAYVYTTHLKDLPAEHLLCAGLNWLAAVMQLPYTLAHYTIARPTSETFAMLWTKLAASCRTATIHTSMTHQWNIRYVVDGIFRQLSSSCPAYV